MNMVIGPFLFTIKVQIAVHANVFFLFLYYFKFWCSSKLFQYVFACCSKQMSNFLHELCHMVQRMNYVWSYNVFQIYYHFKDLSVWGLFFPHWLTVAFKDQTWINWRFCRLADTHIEVFHHSLFNYLISNLSANHLITLPQTFTVSE